MGNLIASVIGAFAAIALSSATPVHAQTPAETVRIGYQKSSTLTAVKVNAGDAKIWTPKRD